MPHMFELETPMIIIPYLNFKEFGSMPRSSDRAKVDCITYDELLETKERSQVLVMFVSHRWLTVDHPDIGTEKFEITVEGIDRLAVDLSLDPTDIFLWLDRCSIDQDDFSIGTKGIHSIPGYVERCDALFTPYLEKFAHPLKENLEEYKKELVSVSITRFFSHNCLLEYSSRAWCRVEIFLASNCPMPINGYEYFNKVGTVTRNDRPHLFFGDHEFHAKMAPGPGPRIINSAFKVLNPATGGLSFESDRPNVVELVSKFPISEDAVDEYRGEKNEEGKPHGVGLMKYAAGDEYNGEWRNGLWHGKGDYIYSNGNRYVGDFKNGARDGYGVHYLAVGLRYEGEFRKMLTHGPGRLYYNNGQLKMEGTKVNALWEGKFKEYFPNGVLKFEGSCVESMKNGFGKEFKENGELLRKGYWEDDKYVGKKPGKQHEVEGDGEAYNLKKINEAKKKNNMRMKDYTSHPVAAKDAGKFTKPPGP